MALERLVCSPHEREQLGLYRARDFLEGCVETEDAGRGWVRPWRVSRQQLRILGSCLAWHPGYYKRMARTTAGVCVRFRTDASEVALAIRLDALRDVPRGAPGTSLGATVDGRTVNHLDVREMADGIPGIEGSEGSLLVVVGLVPEGEAPGPGMVPLPGLGREREVAVWLPYMRGAMVRELWCDGTYVHEAPERRSLLVLGDSIGQGCDATNPAWAWTALLAERLGMELFNQSISGQVFQPDFALALPSVPRPGLVVVELGTNYRFEACEAARVAAEAQGFLGNLARMWPHVPTLVLTPMAFDAHQEPTHPRSCFASVGRIIRRAASAHASQHLVEGLSLVGDTSLLADSTHPTNRGHRQMADRLCVHARSVSQDADAVARMAQSVLVSAPTCAFGMAQSLVRGIAKPLYASSSVVLLGLPEGRRAIFSREREEGRAVLGALCSTGGVREVFSCGEGTLEDASQVLGLDVVEPVVLASWSRAGKVKVAHQLASGLRVLDAHADLDAKDIEALGHRMSMAWARGLLAEGRIVGAFEKDELVGMVGELPDGSISMPFVMPGHRNRGWAAALVAAKANQLIEQGFSPWLLVYPYDKSLLRHLKQLGFDLSPATQQGVASRSQQ